MVKAGEKLITVPTKALLTIDSLPKQFKRIHSTISVHGLLASFLANAETQYNTEYDAWRATWPSMDDFKTSMPILWLQSYCLSDFLLPLATRDFRSRSSDSSHLLAHQQVRFQNDWAAVLKTFPDAQYATYLYHWLVVNTRCFYYDLPLFTRARSRHDEMALCPFIDYFNHADQGVSRLQRIMNADLRNQSSVL